MQRPNILLIYTDQQRWDTIAKLGNAEIQTPNLDRLASRGTFFDSAFANCPVCMPSRMSMLSGRYPGTLGIRSNGSEMPEDIDCVQHLLGRYDYHTANIGKLHFKNHASFDRDHRDPHPRYGFQTLVYSDEPGCYDDAYIEWVRKKDPDQVENCRIDTPPAWVGEPIHHHPRGVTKPYDFRGPEELTHTAFVAEETCEFLRRHRNEQFFCIAGIYAPHAPLNPPRRFVERYEAASLSLPKRRAGENFENTSDESWRTIKAYYYALISHVDDQVGRILDTLEQLGLTEQTLVVFTADHGENLGDHGLIGKTQAYDSSSRVPLIFSLPGTLAEGRVLSDIVEAVDIVPTLLDVAGLPQAPEMGGSSLLPALANETSLDGVTGLVGRPSALIEHGSPRNKQRYRAVRTKELLYINYAEGREELYSLSEDPDQLEDLLEKPSAPDTVSLLSEARAELIRRSFDSELNRRRSGHY